MIDLLNRTFTLFSVIFLNVHRLICTSMLLKMCKAFITCLRVFLISSLHGTVSPWLFSSSELKVRVQLTGGNNNILKMTKKNMKNCICTTYNIVELVCLTYCV